MSRALERRGSLGCGEHLGEWCALNFGWWWWLKYLLLLGGFHGVRLDPSFPESLRLWLVEASGNKASADGHLGSQDGEADDKVCPQLKSSHLSLMFLQRGILASSFAWLSFQSLLLFGGMFIFPRSTIWLLFRNIKTGQRKQSGSTHVHKYNQASMAHDLYTVPLGC